MEKTEKVKEKALLAGVMFKSNEDIEVSLAELARLADTAGVEVVGKTHQYIREVTPATLFGSGKVEEMKQQIEELGANLVIVDYELTGSQCKNLSEQLETKVIDRITLILDIFAMRANSNEGKLQVELAQLKYNLPRLSGIVGTSGRFGSAGVGMRGPGESKLEMDKRAVREKIQRLEKEIEKIKQQRQLKNQNKIKSNKHKIVIVGYTNAGKSTLLNAMAKDNIYADDKLFATLDTTSRAIWLNNEVQIILTDTVGFISKLPHALIDAFASTLEETENADLILHVVDIDNKHSNQQVEVVKQVLLELGVSSLQLTIYNKCDKLSTIPQNTDTELYISAKKKIGIDLLKQKIIEIFTDKN